MLLGHWYLVAPNLSFRPLRRAIDIVFAAVALQALVIVLVIAHRGSRFAASCSGRGTPSPSGCWWSAPGSCSPPGVALLTRHFARIRANQPATAMLYVLIISVVMGVVPAHLLFFVDRRPDLIPERPRERAVRRCHGAGRPRHVLAFDLPATVHLEQADVAADVVDVKARRPGSAWSYDRRAARRRGRTPGRCIHPRAAAASRSCSGPRWSRPDVARDGDVVEERVRACHAATRRRAGSPCRTRSRRRRDARATGCRGSSGPPVSKRHGASARCASSRPTDTISTARDPASLESPRTSSADASRSAASVCSAIIR